MRYIFAFTLLIFKLNGFAQLSEDFNDGNFTQTPTWLGDTNLFIINTSFQLQLNNSGAAGASAIYTPVSFNNLDSLEWNIYIKQTFAGSSSNNSRVYLVSNQPDLKSSLNGYFLQFGEANANDAVELFKQNGTSVISVCRASNAAIANSVNASVKVERRSGGLWKLYIDYTGGNNYVLEAQGTDNTFNTGSYFGMLCNYTSSNSTKFYYDNIQVQPIVADTIKPVLVSAQAVNSSFLRLNFSEALDSTGISNNINYSINNGIGNPQSAILDTADNKIVYLTLSSNLTSGQNYNITVNNIRDLNGNVVANNSNATFNFINFSSAASKDVVINEIYADNTSSINLTQINSKGEYIEIYNRSTNYFNLQGWSITSGTSSRTLPAYTLAPNTYVNLCASTDTTFYKNYGPILNLSSALSLTNAGSTIILKDNTGKTIDKITYTDNWYNDSDKKDGGIALERINPNDTCYTQQPNWSGANSVSVGGSPGTINTIYSLTGDNTAPILTNIAVTGPNSIQLCFNEGMDSVSLFQTGNYFINNGLTVTGVTMLNSYYSCVNLVTSTIDTNITYDLSVINVSDCRGNIIAGNNTGSFSIILPANPNDVVINEIMADPSPEVLLPNAEFIELHNRSDKKVNLEKWKIVVGTSSKLISNKILNPGEYLILASNTDTSLFSNYGKVSGLSSALSLTNGGAILTLLDSNNVVIDKVSYSSDWYNDNAKDDGGWTLERVNPNDFCSLTGNWSSSMDAAGGTPGKVNSIFNGTTDIIGPVPTSVSVISSTEIMVIFNETLDSVYNNNPLLFSLTGNNAPSITSSKVLAPFYNQILFTLSNSLSIGQAYVFNALNTKDCKGNISTTAQLIEFGRYRQPLTNELLINEIMADPDPTVGLPNFEYIEIYNRSGFTLNLEKVQLKSGSSKIVFPAKSINPGQYLLLIDDQAEAFYSGLNNKLVFTSLISPPNDGGTLTLTDSSGNIIHTISYTTDWYKNNQKDDGGWSLEQIDFNNPCGEELNWKASENINGGTPGYVNSVFASNPDTKLPKLQRVSVLTPNIIEAFFTESVDSAIISVAANFEIDNGIGNPLSVNPVEPAYKSVLITLPAALDSTKGYTLTVSKNIKDCAGNIIDVEYTSARFGIPRFPQVEDILINEFLTDPYDGGDEFIEIYNKSDKIIDLKYLSFLTFTSSGALSTTYPLSITGYLMFPGDYFAITENTKGITDFYSVKNELGIVESNIPSLSNTEGSIVLGNINNDELDRIDYTSENHFPLLSNTKGVSLERISLLKETNNKSNWHSAAESVGFATPAAQNSQWIDGGYSDGFTLSSDIFSPDNDGYNDVLSINYTLEKEGMLANVNIYDGAGRVVKQLIKNELLGSSGQMLWDGVNDNNQKAAIGPYIIVIELTDINGTISRIRKTCVLAIKL